MAEIILDKINYTYSDGTAYEIQALKDVNLQIHQGEFIGIIGHTGSGKSTLTQLLNGLLRASSGSIYVDGQDIYDEGYDMKALRSKVGLVFQYPDHQLFETTCFEDVCFGPKNQGLDRRDIELRAFEALRNVGFPEELFYQPPFDLSGGQKRRVAIAGVLAMKPDVLLLLPWLPVYPQEVPVPQVHVPDTSPAAQQVLPPQAPYNAQTPASAKHQTSRHRDSSQ